MIVNTKNAFRFIFLTILIDCIGIGIIIPIMPDLISELGNISVNKATQIGGWLLASYAFMQFIFSPILGGISDRYGRRPVLLISLLGLGFDYILMSFAPDLAWLFVGRIIAGICGASFTTGMAYIADISKPENRAKNFGLVGLAFGVGFIIGPLLGTFIAQFGMRAPFMVAAALSLANFLYGYFILPESLSIENRRKFEWKRANPFGSLKHLKKYPAITGLIFGMFLLYLAGQTMPSIWSFYTKYQFAWDEAMIGYSLAFVGVSVAIVQGGLVGLSMKKLGDRKSVYLGLLFNFLGFSLFTFANQPWMMFAFTAIYAMGGIGPPALQGIISNDVPPNEQGELQGVLTSLQSLTTIINPILMTNLFYFFTKSDATIHFPGIAFGVSAFFIALSLVVIYLSFQKRKLKNG
jgi:DHA1 family tetracycline resistance protein-like MFS transporter